MLTCIFAPGIASAQEGGDLKDVFSSISLASFSAVVASVIALTRIVLEIIPNPKKWLKVFIPVLISMVLSGVGYFLQIGVFAGVDIGMTLFYAVLISVSSLGTFDAIVLIPFLSKILKKK